MGGFWVCGYGWEGWKIKQNFQIVIHPKMTKKQAKSTREDIPPPFIQADLTLIILVYGNILFCLIFLVIFPSFVAKPAIDFGHGETHAFGNLLFLPFGRVGNLGVVII